MKLLINHHELEFFCGNSVVWNLKKLVPLDDFSKVFILTDSNLKDLCQSIFDQQFDYQLIVVPSGDKHKNLETAEFVWNQLLEYRCDRNSLLINFGGGMISDLGGFVAATFMRGISFINIPTSFLSQVDATIGGKTAVNFADKKNILGLFKNPQWIIIDPVLTKSLSQRELLSGFAEVIKHAILFDKELFDSLSNKQLDTCSLTEIEKFVNQSCLLKLRIVESDFFEEADRKLLNLGHTIGHAFESASLDKKEYLTHGEAVAIGLLLESEISLKMGLLSKKDFELIKNLIRNNYSFILPREIKVEDIVEQIKFDKKNVKGKVNWTLPLKIGKASFDNEVKQDLVKEVISSFIKHEQE